MLKKCLIMAGLVMGLSPASARADWLLTPHVGTTFGTRNTSFTYGASVGWMDDGILGWEAEFSTTPDFLEIEDDDPFDLDINLIEDEAVSAMFNGIVGIPFGGTSGKGFRPYFVGGIGLIQGSIQLAELFQVESNNFGFDLGAGAIGFIDEHLGIRGDIRYYQTLGSSDLDNPLLVDIADFSYWRGTVGVTLRW